MRMQQSEDEYFVKYHQILAESRAGLPPSILVTLFHFSKRSVPEGSGYGWCVGGLPGHGGGAGQ